MHPDSPTNDVLKYLDRRVPRYTSYPTAMQFGAGIGHDDYARWLAALPAESAVSLYIHVPFCAELCLYCGCHTTVARQYAPVAAYLELLRREIGLVAGIVGRRTVAHLHWGGGTPTIVRPADFAAVMDLLRAHFSFAPDAELAIEIDPRTMTQSGVVALAAAGINRASLGVQDFDEQVQAAVNRVQSFEQTAQIADWLRQACIGRINLDLMYGLPHQTAASVASTVRRALALEPDRIALFGYAHVPWMKRHQRLLPEAALPGDRARFTQSNAASAVITAAGYQPIGLDHFARDDDPLVRSQRTGRLHRNFQVYTTDEADTLIGFGTSAIGRLPEGYVQNASSTVAYRDAVMAGRLATTRGHALTAEDRLRRELIERLMCDLEIDLAALCTAHGVKPDHFDPELSRLDAFINDGLIERTGRTFKILERARPLVRTVCAVFDAHNPPGEPRFSRAS